MSDLDDLKYDVPEDADGPEFRVSIQFDETELRFFVHDDVRNEASEWIETGSWRATSLWLARQLRRIGSPVALGTITPDDEGGPATFEVSGTPSHVSRSLEDDETLSLLTHSYGYWEDIGERFPDS